MLAAVGHEIMRCNDELASVSGAPSGAELRCLGCGFVLTVHDGGRCQECGIAYEPHALAHEIEFVTWSWERKVGNHILVVLGVVALAGIWSLAIRNFYPLLIESQGVNWFTHGNDAIYLALTIFTPVALSAIVLLPLALRLGRYGRHVVRRRARIVATCMMIAGSVLAVGLTYACASLIAYFH